jgi:hypothetical protein
MQAIRERLHVASIALLSEGETRATNGEACPL